MSLDPPNGIARRQFFFARGAVRSLRRKLKSLVTDAMRSRIVFIVDYGDWLSTDITEFLRKHGYDVILRRHIHQWLVLRLMRLVLRLFGPRPIIHDRRRILEFAVMDILVAAQLLFRRPGIFIYFKDQILISAALARFLGISTVCVFGSAAIWVDRQIKSTCRRFWERIERAQCTHSDLIVCESSFVKRTLPPQRIAIVHSFLPPAVGLPPAAGEPASRHIGTSKSSYKVLFVGREERKGLELVRQAADCLAGIDVVLIAITDGQFLGKSENVIHLSMLPHAEFISLLQGVDAVLIPTFSDGGPRVLFEALRLGKTAICSWNCAARDLWPNPRVVPISLTVDSIVSTIELERKRRRSGPQGARMFAQVLVKQQQSFLRLLEDAGRGDASGAFGTADAANGRETP